MEQITIKHTRKRELSTEYKKVTATVKLLPWEGREQGEEKRGSTDSLTTSTRRQDV